MLTLRLPRFSLHCCLLPAACCLLLLPACAPPRGSAGIKNDSDTTIKARFWVGQRSEHQNGQAGPLQSSRTVEVAPGGMETFTLTSTGGYRNAQESFVRVEVSPIGASFLKMPVNWYELHPPGPFVVEVRGSAPAIKYDRLRKHDGASGGTMTVVPKEFWLKSE